jgi:hypothetical protein
MSPLTWILTRYSRLASCQCQLSVLSEVEYRWRHCSASLQIVLVVVVLVLGCFFGDHARRRAESIIGVSPVSPIPAEGDN